MLELTGIKHKYPRQDDYVLDNLDLEINQGDKIVVAGLNGSGKSTLANILCGIVTPTSGKIQFNKDNSPIIGYVAQHPENQVLASTVELEIAFGLENKGLSTEIIRQKVDSVLEQTGLVNLGKRNPAKLSGGEMQRVAFAAALALEPDFWVLDEPLAYLDPLQAEKTIDLLKSLDKNSTWIWIASNPKEYDLGNKLAIIHNNQLRVNDTNGIDNIRFVDYNLSAPKPGLFEQVEMGEIEQKAVFQKLDSYRESIINENSQGNQISLIEYQKSSLDKIVEKNLYPDKNWELSINNLYANRSELFGKSEEILQNINLNLEAGKIYALVGQSGSGKSTLIESISGLLKSSEGEISWGGLTSKSLSGRIGVAFQFPERSFFAESVLEEIAFGPGNLGLNKKASLALADEALIKVGLNPDTIGSQNPLTLSVGQARRVALAVIWALRPIAWLLDEPTSGLDQEGCELVSKLLLEEADKGVLVIVAGHDYDTFLNLTNNWIFLEDGTIQKQGDVFELLKS